MIKLSIMMIKNSSSSWYSYWIW